MWHRTIDCLGVAVGITSAIPELAEPLDAVFGTYADATRSPDVAYTLKHPAAPRSPRAS